MTNVVAEVDHGRADFGHNAHVTEPPVQSPIDPTPEDTDAAWKEDAELVAAAGRGDRAAMARLYERYRDWVVALAYRFTGDRELAMDVLQESFVYLVRRAPTLTLTARLTTFLYPAVKNLAQAERRKARREVGGEVVERAAVGMVAWHEDEALSRGLSALSEEQREVVMMRYGCGMSPREIGVALGVPEGTVKSRLHGAMKRLEEMCHW